MSTRAICILNGAAGGARLACDALPQLFSRARAEVRIVEVDERNDATALAREALAENHKLVLAGGGDGTVNAVAAALVDTDAVLGVLPLGTLNHFAKDLRIPLGLEEAVANSFHGAVARVDVGEVNGRIFLNNSCLGIYPGVVQEREVLRRGGRGKWVAFAEALIFAFMRYAPLGVRTRLEEATTLPRSTPFVFVGNNRYQAAGLHIGERSSLDSGMLWVYQAPYASRVRLLFLALQALFGRSNPRELVITELSEFWVRPKARSLRVANDGEVRQMETPLHYRSRPRALNVVVPPRDTVVAGPGAAG